MELKKTLGLSVALSTVISSLIGSGVFFKPQIVYELTGGAPGLGMLAWLVAGLITITAGLTVAELAAIIPKTGGMMVYIKEIYGEKLGFLTGWMQILLFYPGMIAALGVIFADQLTQLIGMPQFLLPISIGIIFIIAALNLLSTKTGGMIQNAATICKLIPIALIIVAGFVVGSGDNPIISPMVGKDVNVSSVIGHVLISVLFAYDGWLNVTTIAGEMKNPGKDLPRAIIGGISIVTAIFLLINLAYLWVLPASELAVNTSPATAVANVIFGPKGGTIIAVGILISIFGTLNSYTLSGSRVVYKLAIDKTLPMHDKLSKLSDSQVPANAIVLIAFVSSIYAISGQYNLLTDLAIFSSWVFYILTFIGVFKLRKSKPDIQRDYKVPLYPVVPILAILSGLYVIFNQLFLAGTQSSLIAVFSLIITACGLPVYYLVQKTQKKKKA